MTESITLIDLALGAAVLVTAATALIPRHRSIQAMSFLGLGVIMSLVWLRLGSVDVALAEAALGSGLLSAVLVWLALRSPQPATPGRHNGARKSPASIPRGSNPR